MIAEPSNGCAELRLRCPPMRLLGGGILAALVIAAAAGAAASPTLPVFKRAAHGYDKLPPVAKKVGTVVVSRRVATALDAKRRPYLVYATLMRDRSICILLVQSNSYRARCAPGGALFGQGRETFSVIKGLIGGVAANDVTRLVLAGGSKRKAVPLTTDHGYIFGCPAPSTCASWVKTVVGYNKAGKIVSRENVG
jgi:hypothetical protein